MLYKDLDYFLDKTYAIYHNMMSNTQYHHVQPKVMTSELSVYNYLWSVYSTGHSVTQVK